MNPQTGAISNFQIQQTLKFRNGSAAFDGIAPNPTNVLGNSLDPEGFAVHPNTGNLFVADEYGPALLEFNRSGQLVRQLTVPASLTPKVGTVVNYNASTAPGTLTSGREPNRGLEG